MKAVLVSPHFDDEILLTGSFLVSYPGDIILAVTHQGDCIDWGKMEVEKKAFTTVINELRDYRESHGLGTIETRLLTFAKPGFLGYSTDSTMYKDILMRLEKLILEAGEISHFVFSAKSGHQNHTESNKICRSVLRDRFTDKIHTVLEAVYPNLLFAPTAEGNDLSNLTAFHEISKEGLEFLKRQLDINYACKVQGNMSYNGDSFEVVCRYFGRCIRKEFAQPYIIKSTKL